MAGGTGLAAPGAASGQAAGGQLGERQLGAGAEPRSSSGRRDIGAGSALESGLQARAVPGGWHGSRLALAELRSSGAGRWQSE